MSTAGPVQLPQIARYNHDIIRRVSFVEKYELLHTWRTLRAERMASTSNLERAIIVEYVKYENRQRIFKVVQGNELVERVDPQAEKKFNVYTYIISPLSEETKVFKDEFLFFLKKFLFGPPTHRRTEFRAICNFWMRSTTASQNWSLRSNTSPLLKSPSQTKPPMVFSWA